MHIPTEYANVCFPSGEKGKEQEALLHGAILGNMSDIADRYGLPTFNRREEMYIDAGNEVTLWVNEMEVNSIVAMVVLEGTSQTVLIHCWVPLRDGEERMSYDFSRVFYVMAVTKIIPDDGRLFTEFLQVKTVEITLSDGRDSIHSPEMDAFIALRS